MSADILTRKQTAFVLWHAGAAASPPQLVIGRFQAGNPPQLTGQQSFALAPIAGFTDLWAIAASACGLAEGKVYHYWFEVNDTHPGRPATTRIRVTDPAALSVDWRIRADRPAGPYGDDDRYPAAVVKFAHGQLVAADPGGETVVALTKKPVTALPPNNRLVIYELPTAWSRLGTDGSRERGVGTFRDVAALIDPASTGANFSDLGALALHRSYLGDLGINALELLPPADSFFARTWGYGTTNYLAPDFELGFPEGHASPTPNQDLSQLVEFCHEHGIRFFVDIVMAFARCHAYLAANTDDFFMLDPGAHPGDPDAHDSRGGIRDAFGSTLLRYDRFLQAYDPVSGHQQSLSPARQLMKSAVHRWMQDFGVDGFRLDSIENIASWDFVQEFKDLAHSVHRARFAAADAGAADQRFLVVGEELQEPLALLSQNRLDGLWHQNFKNFLRPALLGQNHPGDASFEQTVRKAIDCRNFGYRDMTEAVIYLTSHDVEGPGNERLFNFFKYSSIFPAEPRIKLAFACLLTAVGLPMILAGDEFADEHDLFNAQGNVSDSSGKEVDPVNFSRLHDDWRQRIQTYVSALIHLRTSYDALSVNDTDFIHVDFNDGKRVLVWRRGQPGSNSQVVVLANFSDYSSPGPEYVVPNWPATPGGKHWREIPQGRDIPPAWVAREPIFPWEAKVYALV